MSDHTPGPWAVLPGWSCVVVPAEHVGRYLGGATDPDREAADYAKVIHESRTSDDFPEFHRTRVMKAEAQANARLIAAAPDLLAALKAASDELVLHPTSPLRQQIDAAIAKAEGRA